MHVKIKVYEVSATGDAGVVREALQPLLDAMSPKLGATMSGETVAFLAAHGFTAEDYYRGRGKAEDVEAFVARRELEQAGIRFTRTAPGPRIPDISDKDIAWLQSEGFTEAEWASARLEGESPRAFTARRRGWGTSFPHVDLEPKPVVPDLKGQDPNAVRDRMNALPSHPAGTARPVRTAVASPTIELPSGMVLAWSERGDLFAVTSGPYPWPIGYVLVGKDEPLLATFGDLKAVRAAVKARAPAQPTGCGLYPTEKGEAVPAPTPKRKPRKAAPKPRKRVSR